MTASPSPPVNHSSASECDKRAEGYPGSLQSLNVHLSLQAQWKEQESWLESRGMPSLTVPTDLHTLAGRHPAATASDSEQNQRSPRPRLYSSCRSSDCQAHGRC